MVELAATIVVVVFLGYVINGLAKSRDVSRRSARVDAFVRQRDALMAKGAKGTAEYRQLQAAIDREIELLEITEKRDISPLR